jgi:hypothetical protein
MTSVRATPDVFKCALESQGRLAVSLGTNRHPWIGVWCFDSQIAMMAMGIGGQTFASPISKVPAEADTHTTGRAR